MSKYIELVVRGFHLDVFGHVNNCRYLEFLEEARWALMGECINSIKHQDWTHNIVNININYRLPTFLNQTLLIDAKITRVGNTSFTIHQDVIIKETQELAADADIICVISDNKTGKAIPFAGELERIFKKFIVTEVVA